MISCILLAAGLSQRFGSPKALALWGQHSILEQQLSMLKHTQVNQVIVVLGAHAELLKPFLLKHTNINVVYNKDYKFGQTSSFKAGLQSISPQSIGIMLFPVDFPAIQAQTVDLLISRFNKDNHLLLIPTHHGRKGHPPIFSINLKQELLALDDSEGINTIVHRHEDKSKLLAVDDSGVIDTFNTQEELLVLKKKYGVK